MNRRREDRFTVPAQYTPVTVRTPAGQTLHGHAYNISLSGLRFELDDAVEPGTQVLIEIDLPGPVPSELTGIFALHANTVWLADPDEPPPYKMAATVTKYASESDRAALADHLATGAYGEAA